MRGFLISTWDLPHFDRALDSLKSTEPADINPDALAYAEEHYEKCHQLVALKKQQLDGSLLEKIDGWKTIPYPDQLQCVNFHINRGRSLEASETGVGKTITLLYTFLYWKTQGVADKGIIICTNTGKLDWETQIWQHTKMTPFVIGNGTGEVLGDLSKFKRGSADLLVVHYESFKNEKVLDALKSMEFMFVGIDECHMIKNPKSDRHKKVMKLLECWPKAKIVAATGTAVDGNPKSAWAILKVVEEQPNHYFPTYNQFAHHFIEFKEKYFYRRKVMAEVGFKNLGRLKELLEPAGIRFLKKDVIDRPTKIFETRIVTLTGGQKKLYEEVKKATFEELVNVQGENIPLVGVATRLLRLRQILNHPKIIESIIHFEGDSAKHVELDDVIEMILSNPEAQLLVWTQWREAVKMLVQRYRKYGAIAYFGGSDDREVRDTVLSHKTRVVIAIPEKAGTSVDWLKVCRTAIYLEKPWSLSLYRQSLDRIDRRTNVDPALIINIECESSVDQIVDMVLRKRQGVFDALTIEDEKLVAMNKSELLAYLK